ncbi:MAG: N-acetylmuramoyl-L-alanine amidase, partial [Deltaproteobacteria bacterium]|nr:N-acetylmuramoyl-L-alanine amidase [Deltaproteobacteria bacterium]
MSRTHLPFSSTLLLLAAAACAQGPREAVNPHLAGDSPLVDHFKASAAEADLPADVLAAWSWMETRFTDVMRDGDDHGNSAFGVMGLSEAQLVRAAALLGIPVDAVRTDAAANIRGAAYLARTAADARGWLEGRLTAGSSAVPWLEVLADARELQDDGLRFDYQQLVAKLLSEGATEADQAGRTVIIEGRGHVPVTPRTVVMQGVTPDDPYSARYVASPNYSSRNGADVDTIVIHDTEGSYSGSISWLANTASQASAHYCIRSSDGQITQMVKLANKAWHAGNSGFNARSVGIEHEGYVSDPSRWFTDVMYRKSADLVKWLANRYAVPLDRTHIIGHYQVPSSGNGAPCSTTATNCGGAGHHTDPGNGGRGWRWDYYLSLIRGGSTSSGGTSGGGTTTAATRVVGVVFNAAAGTSARIAGATVKLLRNGSQVGSTTSSSTGFWAFNITTTGTYQVKAEASGYVAAERDAAAATSGADNWASLGLTPAPPPAQTGTFRGVIYAGANLGENPVEGAVVRLSGGQAYTTGANGVFIFELGPGDVTATATKDGYEPATETRTVSVGATVWGSMRLLASAPEAVAAPPVPNAISPVGDVTVPGAAVALTFSRVTDAAGADITYDVEVYLGDVAGAPLVALAVPQAATSPVVATVAATLEAGVYSWRVRARSTNGNSAWSPVARFHV